MDLNRTRELKYLRGNIGDIPDLPFISAASTLAL